MRGAVRVAVAGRRLRPIEADYRWLARVYASVQPVADPNALLWHRLGAKTGELLGTYISDVEIDAGGLETIAIDAGTLEALKQLELFPQGRGPLEPPTVDDVLDTLAGRLRRKLAGPACIRCGEHCPSDSKSCGASGWRVPATRSSSSSACWSWLARSSAPSAPRPRVGSIASRSSIRTAAPLRRSCRSTRHGHAGHRGTGRRADRRDREADPRDPLAGEPARRPRSPSPALRLVLKNNGLPPAGDLYDRAYDYIREHY